MDSSSGASMLPAVAGTPCGLHRISASAQAEQYGTSNMITDLCLFAGEALVDGGHLVFWLPTAAATYTQDEIPHHPLLELLCNESQNISLKVTRRLVVMRKIRDTLSRDAYADLQAGKLCRPVKATDEVRLLMDVIDVPENADYQHYRAKLVVKREASRKFREMHARPVTEDTPPGTGCDASTARCTTSEAVVLSSHREEAEGGGDDGAPVAVSVALSKRQQRKQQQHVAVMNRTMRMAERADKHAQSVDAQRQQTSGGRAQHPSVTVTGATQTTLLSFATDLS